jgi:hypothetical protein
LKHFYIILNVKLKYLKKLYISILFSLFFRKLRSISFKKVIRKRLLNFPIYFSFSLPLFQAVFHKDLIKLENIPLPSKISLGHMLSIYNN